MGGHNRALPRGYFRFRGRSAQRAPVQPRRVEHRAEDARRDRARYVTTIDLYNRPDELGFEALNPRTDAWVRFRFARHGDSATDVFCVVELTTKGFMRFAEPLMAPMIRRQIERTRGPMLKAALEG